MASDAIIGELFEIVQNNNKEKLDRDYISESQYDETNFTEGVQEYDSISLDINDTESLKNAYVMKNPVFYSHSISTNISKINEEIEEVKKIVYKENKKESEINYRDE